MNNGSRNNFDALRLIGAFLVLISHQFALSGRSESKVVGDHSFGNLGVLIFFSISGYLATFSWLKDPHIPSIAKYLGTPGRTDVAKEPRRHHPQPTVLGVGP